MEAEIKIPLAPQFLRSAVYAAHQCHNHEKEWIHDNNSISQHKEHLTQFSLTAIIMSAVFLESTINDFFGHHFFTKLFPDLKNENSSKYLSLYLPKKTRDRLSFAFKNAENKPKFSGEHTLLIKFRNYLVHYNPEFLPSNDYILEHSRKNLYKTLINKFNHPYGENETFPRRVLCYESSKWAVKTAAETVIALNSAYGINAPYVAVESYTPGKAGGLKGSEPLKAVYDRSRLKAAIHQPIEADPTVGQPVLVS